MRARAGLFSLLFYRVGLYIKKEKREGYDLKASAGQVQLETTQSACAGSIRGLSCLLREVREAAEVVLDAGKRLSGASARLRPGPVLPQLGSI